MPQRSMPTIFPWGLRFAQAMVSAPLGVLCTNDKGNAEHHSQRDAQLSAHTDAEYAENEQQRKGQHRSRDKRNQHSLGNSVFVVRLHIQDSFLIECDFSHKPQPRCTRS